MNKKIPLFGSSETTRETPFNFDLFYKYGHAKHVPRIPESFLEWFIGFYEGDGSIYFTTITDKKKRFSFQITQKDRQLIEQFKYIFGYGNVSCESRETGIYWKWTLESKESVEKISYLFYGNLIWPYRQMQYSQWIRAGQEQGLFKQILLDQLVFRPPDQMISFQNAWFSGFIDAEGCFYAHLKETYSPKTGNITIKLSQKFTLTQKQQTTDQSEIIIFQHILDLLQTPSKIIIFQNKTKNCFYARIEIWRLVNQKHLIDYLKVYKLKTQKYISYRRWWRVWLRRQEQAHLTHKGRKRLKRLISNINNHTKKVHG